MKHKNLTRLLSLLLTLVLLCSVCLPAYAAGLEAVGEAQMTDSAATEDLAGTEPADTEPADTEAADTEPADTEAADTAPADTEPADTEAADTEPEEELQNTAVPQAACTVSVLESAPTTAETTTGSIYTLDLSTVFTDSEGHTLSYTLSGGDFGQQTKIKDGVLYFSVGAAGDYTPTITATCESGATAAYTPTITVKAASEGSQEQYGYDETPASSVTVYVTVNSDGIPIRGNDEKETILSHLKVTVPYFDLADYGLGDFHRYHTENGQGSYVDDVIVERPTALHLYIYLLEHYYMGLPDSACCKGTSGLLDYANETNVYDMNGDLAYTGTNKALNITGSATSLYMQQFWGHDENLMYYRNHVYPLMSAGWGSTADYILLSDDDTIDVAMFSNWNFWSDGGAFARFDKDAYQGRAGAALAVQTLKYDTRSVADGGTESFTPISGLKVGLYDANWKLLQELSSDNGSYTVTLPETAGEYYLLGIDPNHGTMDARFASATARVTVLGDENPDPFADTLFTSVNYADNSGSTAVLDNFTALTGGISDTDGLGNVYKNLPAYTFKIPQSLIGNTVNFVFPAEQGLQPYGMSWSKKGGFGYDAPSLTLKTNDDGTQTLSFDITEDFVGTGKYIVFENDAYKGFLGVTFELGGATGAVAVTGVSLDQTALNVPLGTAPQLTATVMPENATNKDVAWSSSNKTVATVSESGVITPVSEGATIITVTTMDGSYTATCRVTVVDDRTPNLSADGYYEITSAQQLKWFADAVNSDKSSANARLMNDIDLSEVCSAENGSWEPIGTAMKYIAYSGTFDGQGHTISNLYINEKLSNTANGETNDRALFGRVDGGTIKNVTVTGSVTTNARYASGLVGYAIKATIENCHTNVAVTGTGTWGATGIIGFAAAGVTIRNCSNSGPIHGMGTYVAGVVGSGYEITVDGCYNDGEIVCNDFYGEGAVGGVIGYLSSPKAKISNCYNLGTVTTDDSNYRVGGVVGMLYFYSGGTAQISSCYNAGMINSKSSKAGSLAGSVEDRNGKLTGQTAENCFYLLGTCTSDFFGLSSVTEAYLRSAAATAQLNGESGSAYKRGTAHPILSWQPDEPVDTTPEKNEKGFYQLTSADDLLWFADKVNNGGLNAIDAVLMNDIDLSSVENWTPIGSSDTKYLGTFDGQGHAITGLTIQQGDVSATLTLGLFGYAGSGAALKNFTLDGGVTLTTSQQIAGAACGIGSVVGHANGATITDVQSSVSVTVSAPSTKNVGYVGGLAGMTTNAALLRCGTSGTLTLTLTGSGNGIHAGGIVGKAAQSKLEQCCNSGSIDVTPGSITCYVGGLVGNAVSSSAAPSNQLLNCYNAGDVTNYSAGTASQSFGGLVGYLGASSKSGGQAVIKNCFNAGLITATGSTNVGALIGKLYANYGTRENLYHLSGLTSTIRRGIGSVPSGATDDTVFMTDTEFVAADFVTLLNTNSGSESGEVFKRGMDHPIFSWQPDELTVDDAPAKDENGAYQLTSVDDLLWFADKVNNGGQHDIDAVLMNDIDLSSVKNWRTPIGTSDAKYSGTFDGQGHAITGLTISRDGSQDADLYVGLFGYVGSGAVIKNLTLDGSIYIGLWTQGPTEYLARVGALVGEAENATISDVQSNVAISVIYTILPDTTPLYYYVGGIVGAANNMTLLRCGNSGTVRVTNPNCTEAYVGGIVGIVKTGSIRMDQCRNTGTVYVNPGTKLYGVGGLVGSLSKKGAVSITNCYNAGDVTNISTKTSSYDHAIGGLFGLTSGTSNSTMQQSFKNCFNVGTVTKGSAQYCGALTGWLSSNSGVTTANLYYLTGTAAAGIGKLPDGRTDNSIVKTAEEFASADFVTLLNTNSGSESAVFAAGTEHPLLVWEAADTPEPQVVLGDVNGDGKVTNLDAALTYAAYNGTFAMTDAQRAAADVNKDGKVTNLDAALIYSYYNGTLGSFDEIGK